MGKYTKPPYKKLNRETGKWEWVISEPTEFTSEKEVFHAVDVKSRQIYKEIKKRKK